MTNARKLRLAREKAKLERLLPGDVFTLAFLGICSGEHCADTTPTARALPRYSGLFGLAPMDFGGHGNAALLPNGNWRIQALFGWVNIFQLRMARELAALAVARGLRLQVVTHFNGVNAAAAFLSEFPHWVETALVIAPNTRSERAVRRIQQAARSFQLLISENDHLLQRAWFGSRAVRFWRDRFFDGVVASRQLGHGAQSYLAAALGVNE